MTCLACIPTRGLDECSFIMAACEPVIPRPHTLISGEAAASASAQAKHVRSGGGSQAVSRSRLRLRLRLMRAKFAESGQGAITCQQMASSMARTMCALVVELESPRMQPLASGRHRGASRPLKAGTKYTPAGYLGQCGFCFFDVDLSGEAAWAWIGAGSGCLQ